MTLAVVRSPQAERDLEEITDYLAARSRAVAVRFVDSASETFGRLAEQPGLGAPYESDNPRLSSLRVCSVAGFPSYLVFFRTTATTLEIARVVHGARDLESLL